MIVLEPEIQRGLSENLEQYLVVLCSAFISHLEGEASMTRIRATLLEGQGKERQLEVAQAMDAAAKELRRGIASLDQTGRFQGWDCANLDEALEEINDLHAKASALFKRWGGVPGI